MYSSHSTLLFIFFFSTVPILIVSSLARGIDTISLPLSSLLIIPEQTVYPLSPMRRLNKVALSDTLMLFFISRVLSNSSEKYSELYLQRPSRMNWDK